MVKFALGKRTNTAVTTVPRVHPCPGGGGHKALARPRFFRGTYHTGDDPDTTGGASAPRVVH